MAYSQDYRKIVLTKLEEGYSIREVAEEFGISTNTIQRWKKHPTRKQRNHKPLKIDNDKLRKDVELYPDAYQHERASRLNCTPAGICIALKRLGITQKKEPQSPQS